MNWRLLVGDVREKLAEIEAGSVQTCVTSPPYWGLRDYGTGRWAGGDPNCAHRVGGQVQDNKAPGAITTGQRPGVDASRCRECGAQRIDSQIGLERTPDEFVESLVNVFDDVRRVLNEDGTLWLNLGDSYNAYNGGAGPSSSLSRGAQTQERPRLETGYGLRFKGLKPKDLVGVPWRVAFALQADGWYLRNDIIWHKPNPMPESVTDRCTKAHEYVFLLSKSERYYFDARAIAEPLPESSIRRYQHAVDTNEQYDPEKHKSTDGVQTPMEILTRAASGVLARGTRNKRTVWTIPTQAYSGAHFATFPEELPETCIAAGSRQGDTVLDPFAGSGTTGAVAIRLGRQFVGCELNPAYAELARKRIGGEAPLFAHEESSSGGDGQAA